MDHFNYEDIIGTVAYLLCSEKRRIIIILYNKRQDFHDNVQP